MRHPLFLTGRFFITTLFIATSLSASGCGDSATVNEPASLGSLSASPGTLLPPFNPATTEYTVKIPRNLSSTTLTATPRVTGDTIRFDNQQISSQTITLASPQDKKTVTIVVTDSGGGGTSRSYRVAVERDVEDTTLSALSVLPGTLSPSTFDSSTLKYTVNDIGSAVTEVTISATKSDPSTVMEIDSVTVPAGTASGQATVRLGGSGSATEVSIVVTAPGGSKNTYTVTINRGPSTNNFLRSLSVLSGTTALSLVPRFTSGSLDYTVDVASNIGSVSVTPQLDDATATMTVNGQSATSGQAQLITLLPAGQDTLVKISVIAQDKSLPREYSVNVKRAALNGNNNLRSLTVSPTGLNPSFTASTTSYTLGVGSSVSSVTVTPTLDDPTATLTVTSNGPGPITTSRQARTIPLRAAGLSTIINIVVRAQNGSEKPYTITVDRAAPPPPSGNNNLSALTVRLSTSSPNLINFSSNTTSYAVDVESGVSSIRVTPTLEDPAATLTVTSNGPGPIATSGQARTIPLRDAGLSTTISIVVRAQNRSEKPYTITVDRAAPPPPSRNNNLQDLTVSPGTLSPAFTAARTAYTVNVDSSDTAITVTATPQDSSATVEINQQAGNSRSISLPTGPSSTEIEVRVIAPDNTDKRYFITVNQPAPAAPPAPTVAPDLIPEDDSCPLLEPPDPLDPNKCAAGSREDNITNVTTPRFRIPQPAAGQTPNLYVDGTKADSTFDQAANTLQPTTALSDGEHQITYTVTNAGGESGPSPSLTVTINTGAPGAPSP